MFNRRSLIALAAVFLPALAAAQSNAALGDWPSRPIKFVVPVAAGGPADTIARIVAKEVGTDWKPIIVENMPGAGGIIGSSAVARAQPDGYTFLVAFISHATNPSLMKNVPYHYRDDFTPVSKFVDMVSVIVARPQLPANNFQEFVQYAKQNPGKMVWALGSIGSTEHLAGAMLESRAKVKFLQVPYKGAAPAMQDLLADQADFKVESIATSQSYLQAKRLKPIAVTSNARNPMLPDVPTVAESGLPGFNATAWVGLFGPAKLPPAIAEDMAKRVKLALSKPEVVQQLLKLGSQVDTLPTKQFGKFVDDQHDQWAALIKEAGIKVDQ